MTFSTNNFVNPSVLSIFVARTPGGPTTDQLVICTGIAEINFQTSKDNQPELDILDFLVPDENGAPLEFDVSISPPIPVTISLASVGTRSSDTAGWGVGAPFPVLSAEPIKSGPGAKTEIL